jgi:hypothetical protein
MSAPGFTEVVMRLIESQLVDLNVSFPARVESYNRTLQSCSVKPLVSRGVRVENGERVVDQHPVLVNVPVVFPGSGQTADTWELERGDTVLLVISSRSLDRLLVRGGEVDPEDDRRHNINDAVAIPGFRDFAHPIPPEGYSALARVIWANELRLGSSFAETPIAVVTDITAKLVVVMSDPTVVAALAAAALLAPLAVTPPSLAAYVAALQVYAAAITAAMTAQLFGATMKVKA